MQTPLFTRYAHYRSREERNRYCAGLIREKGFGGPILNLGSGGQKFLKTALAPHGYQITDMDIWGEVDVKINLERDMPLPAADKSFETAVCLDVLEHIENFHAVFNELLRVTRGHVIISLPNPSAVYFRNILFDKQYFEGPQRKEHGKYEKYYGLPFEAPPDRHKWFFCYDEALEFFEHHAAHKGYRIVDGALTGRGDARHQVLRRLAPRLYRNLVIPSFWVVLKV